MKISFRILLINFAVVVAILTISAAAVYSVMYNIISSQQERYVLNSTNNFLFSYRGLMQDTEDEFLFLEKNNFPKISETSQRSIDFVLEAGSDSASLLEVLFSGEGVYVQTPQLSMIDFLGDNPYALVKSMHSEKHKYFYGRIFNEKVLNILSQRIGAEIALIWDNSPAEISNSSLNKKYFNPLNKAYLLLSKENSRTCSVTDNGEEILAAKFNPGPESEFNPKLQFIIFTRFSEASNLQDSLIDVLILIGITGVVLSLILTMIFTHKIRKQITDLNNATEVLKAGDNSYRIRVKSKDELGQLGMAFNTMLDVLGKNESVKNQYSEFITLINQNPGLNDFSEAALENIIKNGNHAAGALYIVEGENLIKTSSFGLNDEQGITRNSALLKSVLQNREWQEINFEEGSSDLASERLTLLIKNLLVIPVIYNNKVLALIELGSVSAPVDTVREYLVRIQDQLAIGLANSLALLQLENVVAALKKLNEDYQKQNLQIKEQNEKLLELHKELKEKAEELEVQKKKAEESTKLKSQFLASMSHELRTPMNSILGLTELILEESVLSAKDRQRIEVVLKSSRRLMTLINDILDFSKVEAGKMEVHNDEIHLEEMLNEIKSSFDPLVLPKNIIFTVTREIDTRIMIMSDRGKLVQILINLLGNAAKFTEKGFIDLKISSPSEDILQFDIKDTGIGISEKNQEIIFQEFRQADGSTTRKYDGTGLGLAISSRLCSMLKGSLSLSSKLNEGSTFTLKIPFIRTSIPEIPVKVPVNLLTLFKNRKHPVLVIDDDEQIRFTIGQYLDSRGYEVIFAENGTRGLNLAESVQPFAIVLNLMLPNKEGWTILESLKQNNITVNIPVILISILGDKKAGYGLGAFEYFVKPIGQKEFLSAIAKLENIASKRINKIVVVDDDEFEFEKFRREFKNENIRIDFIKESELAFSKIREIQPDLVVIDLLMPGIDGITLSHKLKSSKETRHIPIIISTAKDISDREKDSLQDIVENITIKGKGHPLDVLKVVRDRIHIQEIYAAADEPSDNNPSQSEEGDKKNELGEGMLEILIVDDDPDALFTINELVQSCGCATMLAKGGMECLNILEQKHPDLILLDIMMPEIDGFQTFKKIRENKKWEGIPVYAVTAKAMLEDKNIILKHGFDDYIFKPVSAGMLAFKLKRLIHKLKVNQ